MGGIGIVEPPHPIIIVYICICWGIRFKNNNRPGDGQSIILYGRAEKNTKNKNITRLNTNDGLRNYNRVRCFSRAVLTTGCPECSNIKPSSTWCREGKSGQAHGRPKVTAKNRANALHNGDMSFSFFFFFLPIITRPHVDDPCHKGVCVQYNQSPREVPLITL